MEIYLIFVDDFSTKNSIYLCCTRNYEEAERLMVSLNSILPHDFHCGCLTQYV